MDKRLDLLDRAVYIAMRLLSAALHCFPISLSIRFARFLGRLLYAIDARHRARAIDNISRAFPAMPAPQVRAMARASMEHLCMLAVEVLYTTRLITLRSWTRHVQLTNFRDTLALLVKQQRGLILLTGHYGNWEILGYVLATLGFEVNVVARPLDNPYVNRWLLGVREKRGQKMIDKTGATAAVTRVIESSGAVAFIADQNAGRKGIFVDFFGRKASTYKSIGLLAMEYQLPIVVGFARRLDAPFTFRAGAIDLIMPADWQDRDDPLRYITQRYTSALEAVVREAPEQYLWAHRRWKSRPKGESESPSAAAEAS